MGMNWAYAWTRLKTKNYRATRLGFFSQHRGFLKILLHRCRSYQAVFSDLPASSTSLLRWDPLRWRRLMVVFGRQSSIGPIGLQMAPEFWSRLRRRKSDQINKWTFKILICQWWINIIVFKLIWEILKFKKFWTFFNFFSIFFKSESPLIFWSRVEAQHLSY